MYTTYFGLSDPPFENNLDQRFFYLSEGHREVLAALLYFVRAGKGFALVCGDVGTGKTMLINCLLDRLPPTVSSILVADAEVPYAHLLRYIAVKLGIPAGHKTSLELFDDVKACLMDAHQRGGRFLLIIDEAHLLSHEALEGVRLLSNLETRREKLLQILLVGQNELGQKLDQSNLRQLRQRININRFLFPLDPEESLEYIDHRLRCVGGSFEACFEPGCRRLIHKMTEGVPRRINLLCDHALLICQAEKAPKVTPKILKLAYEALESDHLGSPKTDTNRNDSSRRFTRGVLKIAVLLAILALAAAVALRAFPDTEISRMLERISARVVSLFSGFSNHAAPLDKRSASAVMPLPSPKEPGTEQTLQRITAGAKTAVAGSLDRQSSQPIETRPHHKGPSNPKGPFTELVEAPAAVDASPSDPRPTEERPAALPSPSQSSSSASTEPAADAPASDTTALTTDIQDPVSALPKGSTPAPRTPYTEPTREESGAERPVLQTNGTHTANVRIVRRGDTLLQIATELTPENPTAAMQAILRLNPEITDKDRIYEGQILHLPGSRSQRSVPLPGAQTPYPYYALYGSYPSLEALETVMNRMAQKGVRYIVVNAPADPGGLVHQVIVGGYETKADLRHALERLNE